MAHIWLIADAESWAALALRRGGHTVEVLDVDDARAGLALGEERDDRPVLVVVDLGTVDAYDFLAEDIGAGADADASLPWVLCIGHGLTDMAMAALYGRGAAMVENDRGHEFELVGAVAWQLERAGRAE